MKRNRANRTKFVPKQQGRKYNRRKCHCKDVCGGHKRNKAVLNTDWKKDEQTEI